MLSITMTKEQFKRLRRRLGYTQQQFGEIIGYAEHSAKQQVYAIETGRTKLTKTRIALMKYIIKIK
jgi:DNA-binding XRE family transcriptional regulator